MNGAQATMFSRSLESKSSASSLISAPDLATGPRPRLAAGSVKLSVGLTTSGAVVEIDAEIPMGCENVNGSAGVISDG